MQAVLNPETAWTHSSVSNPSGNCVEVALLPNGQVVVRDSEDPDGAVLIVTRDTFTEFIAGVILGDFSHLANQIIRVEIYRGARSSGPE
jgi:hypothetical protein